jgi:hypothetical protein
LLLGVFGWLTAHAATIRVLGHAGPGGVTPGDHLHLSGAVLLVGCLAGVSLLAVFAVALLGGRQLVPGRRWSRRALARRSSLLSTGAFVASEFAEHAFTGRHDVPPVGVLVLGCVVHAVTGACTSMLWSGWVDELLLLAALLRGGVPIQTRYCNPRLVRREIAARRSWRNVACAGRAPPMRLAGALV